MDALEGEEEERDLGGIGELLCLKPGGDYAKEEKEEEEGGEERGDIGRSGKGRCLKKMRRTVDEKGDEEETVGGKSLLVGSAAGRYGQRDAACREVVVIDDTSSDSDSSDATDGNKDDGASSSSSKSGVASAGSSLDSSSGSGSHGRGLSGSDQWHREQRQERGKQLQRHQRQQRRELRVCLPMSIPEPFYSGYEEVGGEGELLLLEGAEEGVQCTIKALQREGVLRCVGKW